jgi:hypothetical protein
LIKVDSKQLFVPRNLNFTIFLGFCGGQALFHNNSPFLIWNENLFKKLKTN